MVTPHSPRHRKTVAQMTLQWRHNGHDSVSSHQSHDCLLNRLFRRRSKKTSTLRVTGLCAGNSPGTGEFPTQMASNAENVSIWWRHHGYVRFEDLWGTLKTWYASVDKSINSINAIIAIPGLLQCRHDESDGVSNHWRLDCLLNRLFRRGSKKTSKFNVTGFVRGARWIHLTKVQLCAKCFHLMTSSCHDKSRLVHYRLTEIKVQHCSTHWGLNKMIHLTGDIFKCISWIKC